MFAYMFSTSHHRGRFDAGHRAAPASCTNSRRLHWAKKLGKKKPAYTTPALEGLGFWKEEKIEDENTGRRACAMVAPFGRMAFPEDAVRRARAADAA